MQSGEIKASAIDFKAAPPGLRGQSGEKQQHDRRGGEGEGHDQPGDEREAQSDFQPRQPIRNGCRQPIGQDDLIGVDSGERRQVRADFGDAGSEKEEPEKTPDDDDDESVHGAVIDRSWLREVGRIQVGGELGLEPPLGVEPALEILLEPVLFAA